MRASDGRYMGTARVLFNDALSLHFAGRIAEAISKYQEALQTLPDFADARNNLGAALAGQGRFDEAITQYQQVLSRQPRNCEANGNMGAALAAKGCLADSIAHYESALEVKPGHAGLHFNLAAVLAAHGRPQEAITHYRRALLLKPDYADAHNNLGNLLDLLERPDEATPHYERAIAINPQHAEAHNNLGNMLRERGDRAGALAHYNRAIELAPANAELHLNRSEVKTFEAGDPDLAALKELLRNANVPPAKHHYLHFALAKAFEDQAAYPRAFAHFILGNALKRQQIPYDEQSTARRFHQIAALFGRDVFEKLAGEGDPSTAPIFVLGMPRSGTTLVEQILVSHPQVHGAGESMNLDKASGGVLNPGAILDGEALRRIARNYLASFPGLPEGKTRIVDKLPANFLAIGLIHLILPNAKIIHCMRDPVDTCVSCFSRLFSDGQYFSYSLGELGRYYRLYHELMAHWRRVLPAGAMLDVVYEDVVDDFENQARRMLAWCGLPWDDGCLSFHTTARRVKTASAVQVRRPLYRTSMGRWRRYAPYLGPLLEELSRTASASVAGQEPEC